MTTNQMKTIDDLLKFILTLSNEIKSDIISLENMDRNIEWDDDEEIMINNGKIEILDVVYAAVKELKENIETGVAK